MGREKSTGRCAAGTLAVMLATVAGCAGGGTREGGAAPAPEAVEARAEACGAAMRDVQLWCREGLNVDNSPRRFDCLDARMRVGEFCYQE